MLPIQTCDFPDHSFWLRELLGRVIVAWLNIEALKLDGLCQRLARELPMPAVAIF
jgi:hypothetical protein